MRYLTTIKRVMAVLTVGVLFALTASAVGGRSDSSAGRGKGDGCTRVYMFGVATTFNDSIVVLTDIHTVDSAYVTKGRLLPERALYSYQLEYYLEEVQHKPGAMVAVYWDTDRRKVEKQFLRVRRRFNDDETTHLVPLVSADFHFIKVEHVED